MITKLNIRIVQGVGVGGGESAAGEVEIRMFLCLSKR
jgi:hypothetical protein